MHVSLRCLGPSINSLLPIMSSPNTSLAASRPSPTPRLRFAHASPPPSYSFIYCHFRNLAPSPFCFFHFSCPSVHLHSLKISCFPFFFYLFLGVSSSPSPTLPYKLLPRAASQLMALKPPHLPTHLLPPSSYLLFPPAGWSLSSSPHLPVL